MPTNKALTVGAALALVCGHVSGHMIMIEPHPFNLDTEPVLQVGPLNAELPWPCQHLNLTAETTTTVTAGSSILVKFQGSIVHGGGSCQFSTAYGDNPPEDVSEWKVIYSIIGGCPAQAEGQLTDVGTDAQGRIIGGPECGNDSGTKCLRQFNIPIPKEMKNGKAIFAWTWFNKIGNREMYMNCAPIKITGGSGDSSFMDSLPAPFQANVPGQCTTSKNSSIIGFPKPGKYGKVNGQITPDSQGTCDAPSDPAFEDSAGGDSSEPAASGTNASSAPASTAPASPSQVTSVSTSSAEQVVTTEVVPVSSDTPVASQTSAETPASSGRPSWADRMEACPPSGQLICFSESTFRIYNFGWALP
ncbi:hypothetical protein B0T10DRAFT_596210 [Thelonectria olida]|uniref:Lytic polysaccharide monooxygenase n=1 Tax=Thelonectria olida TaxID=1576542 RepID=A0A9P8VPP0_9HYPO|nr:hypothetical protein B0T10DRAFT_596210 [Thelonectria olida]